MARVLLLFAFLLTVQNGLCYEFGSAENPCGREPADISLPKRDGSNGYTIAFEGHVNPTTYVPGKTYQVTLRSTPPVSFKGFFLIALRETDIDRSAGSFRILDSVQTEVQPGCPYAIKDNAAMTKTRVSVEWTAPPAGAGCVVFKATVIQKKKVWFMDDGPLTLQLCEGEDPNESSSDPTLECCACGSPKYKITFEGTWSARTHRDFPGGYGDHWSDLIGASHTREYTIWEYGGYSTLGVKRVAELGSPIQLEREIRAQGSNVKTVITAPALWPAVGNMTALFRTNRTHNLVSALTMLGPSPDWCVGVSKVNLCTEDCSWEEYKVVDLLPWDAGTDSGVTYRSTNAPTNPQEPIHTITSSFPSTPQSPFYDPSGEPIPPLGRIHFERIELRDMSCDTNTNTGEDDLNLNTGEHGMVKPGMTKPGMNKPPMMPPKTGMMNKGHNTTMPPKVMPPKEMPPKVMPPKEMPPKEMPAATEMPAKQMPPGKQMPQIVEIQPPQEMPIKVMPGVPDGTFVVDPTMPPKQSRPVPGIPDGIFVVGPTMPPKQSRPDRPVIDCMMTEFGPWGECSRTCGRGTMVRKRMIKRKPKNGGIPCGKTKEKKKCQLERCPRQNRDRDCKMTEWSDWFPCSVSCGEGDQKRMRQIKKRPRGNGLPCEPSIEERVCFNPPCP